MINIGKVIAEVPELLTIVSGFSSVEKIIKDPSATPEAVSAAIESEGVNVANAINDITGNVVTSDHIQQLGDAVRNVFLDMKNAQPKAS